MITDLQKLKDNLIHIYNRNNFLIQVPQIHPDLPKYN